MFPASAMEEIFEPNHFPALLYSAKQEYGQKRHNRTGTPRFASYCCVIRALAPIMSGTPPIRCKRGMSFSATSASCMR